MTAPDAADALYDVPPAEFVAARAALVKDLRAAGEKELAGIVGKLRRPTPTAYALNQVARQQPEVLAAALDARAALKEATVGGGDVRDATAADRDATRELVGAARRVLGTDDTAFAQRVTATLLAAVVDDEVAAELRAGRLTTEQTSPGFGFSVDDADVIPFKRPVETRVTDEDERDRRRAEADRRKLVARLESRAKRLAEKAEEAELAAVEARRESDAAEAELEAARGELEG